jgi:hypothetical protein
MCVNYVIHKYNPLPPPSSPEQCIQIHVCACTHKTIYMVHRILEYSKARNAFFRLSVYLFQTCFTFPWINMTTNNPKEILTISYTIFN